MALRERLRGAGRLPAGAYTGPALLFALLAITSLTWGCAKTSSANAPAQPGLCGSTACGSSGQGSQDGVINGISPTTLPNGSVGTFYSQTFQVSGGTGPYSWTTSSTFAGPFAGQPLPAGLAMGADTGVLSGTPSAAGGTEFVVRVVDSERPTPAAFTAVVLLSIAHAPLLSITTGDLPNATVSLAYHTVLQASGGVPPYSWSITSGVLPSGFSLTSTSGAITGMSAATGDSAFTVRVTDSQSPPDTVTANFSITVFAPQNSLLKGSYAFLVSGYITLAAPQTPVAWAGSLVADGNGNISGVIDNAGPFLPLSDTPVTGTYIIGVDQRGTLTINTNGAGVSALTFEISVGSVTSGVAAKAALTETDATKGAGFLEQQDTSSFSTSAMTGNYTLGIRGKYLVGGVEMFAGAVGSFAANGGTMGSGLVDSVDNGSIVANSSVLSGGYSVGASGRGQMILNGVEPSPISATFYAVSASKWLFLASSASTVPGNPIIVWTGTVLQQSGTPFTMSSLNATSVFEQNSAVISGSSVRVGLITFQNGNASLTLDENDAGLVSSQTETVSYSLIPGSNGRLTATATGSSPPIVGYLIAPNECFLLSENQFGDLAFIEPQSGGPFTHTSLFGFDLSFFSTMPLGAEVHRASGSSTGVAFLESGIFSPLDPVHLVCAGNVSLITDTDTVTADPLGSLTSSVETTVSCDGYTLAANGRVTTASGLQVLYVVSPTKVVSISLQSGNPNPTMGVVQE